MDDFILPEVAMNLCEKFKKTLNNINSKDSNEDILKNGLITLSQIKRRNCEIREHYDQQKRSAAEQNEKVDMLVYELQSLYAEIDMLKEQMNLYNVKLYNLAQLDLCPPIIDDSIAHELNETQQHQQLIKRLQFEIDERKRYKKLVEESKTKVEGLKLTTTNLLNMLNSVNPLLNDILKAAEPVENLLINENSSAVSLNQSVLSNLPQSLFILYTKLFNYCHLNNSDSNNLKYKVKIVNRNNPNASIQNANDSSQMFEYAIRFALKDTNDRFETLLSLVLDFVFDSSLESILIKPTLKINQILVPVNNVQILDSLSIFDSLFFSDAPSQIRNGFKLYFWVQFLGENLKLTDIQDQTTLKILSNQSIDTYIQAFITRINNRIELIKQLNYLEMNRKIGEDFFEKYCKIPMTTSKLQLVNISMVPDSPDVLCVVDCSVSSYNKKTCCKCSVEIPTSYPMVFNSKICFRIKAILYDQIPLDEDLFAQLSNALEIAINYRLYKELNSFSSSSSTTHTHHIYHQLYHILKYVELLNEAFFKNTANNKPKSKPTFECLFTFPIPCSKFGDPIFEIYI